MPEHLEVWLFNTHIGKLSRHEGRLIFTYTPAWLNAPDARPLSQSLPLQPEPFGDRSTRPFFAGLLPEEDKRTWVARALGVSKQNDFALLHGIGGECAGAVTLLESEQTPLPMDAAQNVRWIHDTELPNLLDELPKRPMLAGEDGLRLSLAGAQDKIPVVVSDQKIGLPLLNTPSSHILKPAIPALEGTVYNEGFCLALAEELKLDTARAVIRQVADRTYLLVERYDRQRMSDGQIQRLHQEDFCQAMGVAPEYKYQNEGGPDLSACFNLLRRASRPSAPQILKLLDYVVFNALIGNHDAHAKNFSLLYSSRGTTLAPLYDALSTAVYPRLTKKMAMKIGGKYRFTEVFPRHWIRFAESAGLSPAQATKRILTIAKRLPELAQKVNISFQKKGMGHPLLSEITTLIENRCELTLKRFSDDSS